MKRENLILLLGIGIFGILIFRLWILQIVKGNYYRALAIGLNNSFVENKIERGKIFLKGGEPLALNKEVWYLFAISPQLKEKEKIVELLSKILNIEKENLLKNLSEKKFFVIKENLTEEEMEKIKSLNLEGIFLEKKLQRYYPQKNLASNILGFVDKEGNGRYGLEENFDQKLKSGENLKLTLDFRVQLKAEEILKKEKERLNFENGQILVMEPSSGKIIAMANFPNFDPNNYSEYITKMEIFKNPLTQNLFEPGSVLKPITMAIALQEGKITPETTYRDPGEIRIGGWIIKNYDERQYPGDITMTEVLEKSINTGAVFAQQKVEKGVYLNYLKKFGFFEKTGIELPEVFSENNEIKTMKDIVLATASFGQGIAMTPIQLARAFCALANGGNLVTPYLIENTTKEVLKNFQIKKIISQKTSNEITKMLVSVVEKGFGKRAKISGYYIAGKTGTALQPAFGKRGYSNKTWQSFVGYFPAFNPQFLILVKLDNPNTKTAEYSAAPIFKEMAEFLIHIYQIPPDYEPTH